MYNVQLQEETRSHWCIFGTGILLRHSSQFLLHRPQDHANKMEHYNGLISLFFHVVNKPEAVFKRP